MYITLKSYLNYVHLKKHNVGLKTKEYATLIEITIVQFLEKHKGSTSRKSKLSGLVSGVVRQWGIINNNKKQKLTKVSLIK